MSVTQSILLYRNDVWVDTLKQEKYRRRMAALLLRRALRIACSYRTISESAALVIAVMIPVSLRALGRKTIC